VTFGASLMFLEHDKIVLSDALLESQFAPAFLLVAHARVPTQIFGRVAFAFASQSLR